MRDAVGAVGSVLLLGGRSEIGAAVAERLVRGGARRVVLAARGDAGTGEVARRLRAAGADEVRWLEFDAARPDTHAAVVDGAVELLGDLDAVVDAFGVLGDQAAFEDDPAAAAEAAAANYTGHVSAGLAVARRLREQGHGTLVVLSSVAGVRVRRANFVYGSAKAGLDGFAQGLGDALHGTGARVLLVRPGYVPTRMSAHVAPAPFPATAGQVAEAVAEGLRTGAETVWVPRRLRLLFAGMRALPRPLWRRLPR
ncbi:decaprenylphospho-beta-D-erythro-pentofuranosid-2-ulose 2-reductase [Streptomonospora wellingtoniae]|uniref:Decaprenylphospho-beta-D-erythro-pentofuranosid-2-ulose 2-reductase n=1 Tax=Streptomonospora wellingtoniae TaxID=3075544 RepID=A0ABU2KQU3_9ACTN|nr:decaprenylphospho-beta-D-erythro-pentofuranosid-2-ulose 2-reductase [Streptomonospora sp. DSM 45055]MDT0301656.1 decaprenylphospho-beta-D-erythro-pentofuranosid-2-ulose 2-reductase [Streptomonospora sp. DSM 45055]